MSSGKCKAVSASLVDNNNRMVAAIESVVEGVVALGNHVNDLDAQIEKLEAEVGGVWDELAEQHRDDLTAKIRQTRAA
jgi:hypothetical protein